MVGMVSTTYLSIRRSLFEDEQHDDDDPRYSLDGPATAEGRDRCRSRRSRVGKRGRRRDGG